jgi:hypothetical protein
VVGDRAGGDEADGGSVIDDGKGCDSVIDDREDSGCVIGDGACRDEAGGDGKGCDSVIDDGEMATGKTVTVWLMTGKTVTVWLMTGRQ